MSLILPDVSTAPLLPETVFPLGYDPVWLDPRCAGWTGSATWAYATCLPRRRPIGSSSAASAWPPAS